jgi:hypothetical protein
MVPDPGGTERGEDAVASAETTAVEGAALMGGALETAAAASAMAAVSDSNEVAVDCWEDGEENSESEALERLTDIANDIRKRQRNTFDCL